MSVRFPGESADYRAARDRLLEQEVELRRAMEGVAAARRALPPGGPVLEDYVFEAARTRWFLGGAERERALAALAGMGAVAPAEPRPA